METRVIIDNGPCELEAVLNHKDENRAVVITHPHPLFGGDMNNAVVMALARVFSANGISTLRFNFRGTGHSKGAFDEGIGEQEDVASAIGFLQERGYSQLYLAGYSFGSKINASVLSHQLKISELIRMHLMVSPPVAFMSFDDVVTLPKLDLVVTGSFDEFAPESQIQTHLKKWDKTPGVHVIEGGDHFYSACMGQLENIIDHFLRNFDK